MKINTVGFGTTNGILVDRGWMGTGITTHPVGVAVTKVDGAYNIVDNHINFYTAPRGPIPIGSITNPPDERLDRNNNFLHIPVKFHKISNY